MPELEAEQIRAAVERLHEAFRKSPEPSNEWAAGRVELFIQDCGLAATPPCCQRRETPMSDDALSREEFKAAVDILFRDSTTGAGFDSSSIESHDQAQRDRIAEREQQLGNLLAVMHGDGGHYISDNGWAKAATDAEAKYLRLNQSIDSLTTQLSEAVKQRDEAVADADRQYQSVLRLSGSLQSEREIIAELRGRLESAGWRPIETAPRDTKSRLVWCPDIRCTFVVTWTNDPPAWIIFGGHGTYLRQAPTLWMPIPAPPKEVTAAMQEPSKEQR